ncbi:MAG: DUF1731 domain-containing protein [Acidobacteria bacterium]|nr:DUF1731 domain-containing protein [Acidobacteriota bacterium]
MKIAVTGSTGLVGSALVPALAARGHEVVRLVRKQAAGAAEGKISEAVWHPERGEIDAAKLAGVGAAVHLAGENISEGRWTEEKKRRIMESRRRGTRLVAETLAQLTPRPRAFVSASAMGYYGDRGDEVLTEESASGQNFVAEVCREWEAVIGRVINRPTVFPVPAFAARLAFGEMADELLLASARVEPAKLQAAGFEFKHPTLEGALRHLLGK